MITTLTFQICIDVCLRIYDRHIRWLHGQNCDSFAKEVSWNGEMVDAIEMK